MTSECIICFQELNTEDYKNNLWKCNNCNIELHLNCKKSWDQVNSKKSCPHCRSDEVSIDIISNSENITISQYATRLNNRCVVFSFVYPKKFISIVTCFICIILILIIVFLSIMLNEFVFTYNYKNSTNITDINY